MKRKLLIALGGNALGDSPEQQKIIVKQTAKSIVDLAQEGYEVIIGHGNGPQVGMINLAMDFASNSEINTPYMPFAECGAMSQGYIGYHLQQAIGEELRQRGVNKPCVTIITQVIVDKEDPAFKQPTKPIGSFYTKAQADKIAKEKGFIFMEDAGRGYRRVIPSPAPLEIVESSIIHDLVANDAIVITVGGGGIPVIKTEQGLQGVDAVIDKDRSCSKLAIELGVDILLILTAVPQVAIYFNTPNQKNLDVITVSEAKHYIQEEHFAKGSMLPKVEACLEFVEKSIRPAKAIITSLEEAASALRGETGTAITADR